MGEEKGGNGMSENIKPGKRFLPSIKRGMVLFLVATAGLCVVAYYSVCVESQIGIILIWGLFALNWLLSDEVEL